MIEVRGVTGDLVPILAWSWTAPADLPEVTDLPAPTGADAPTPAMPSADAPPLAAATPPADDAAAQHLIHETPAEPVASAQPGSAVADAALPTESGPTESMPAESGPQAAPDTNFAGFLGSRRDGEVRGIHLARDWSAQPPRELWRQPIGPAWSGFAIVDGHAFTQEQRGDKEAVSAYDLKAGALLWQHSYPARYETTLGGIGPRATPSVGGGRVFARGALGRLVALDQNTGRLLWSRDFGPDHGGGSLEWGQSGSPLLVDDRVIVNVGGNSGYSVVAYDAATGDVIWHGGDDPLSYSSVITAELGGQTQAISFNGNSVTAFALADGTALWRIPFVGGQPNVAAPVPLPGDRLLVSAGYGVGSKLLQLQQSGDTFEVSWIWETPRLKSKFANIVTYQGSVYGLDDGTLVCLDPETGERRWKAGRYGHGQLLLVEDLLLVQTEKGAVVLIEPNPTELRELGRFEALSGKAWNPPALAGSTLLVRNDREMVAYQLPLASASTDVGSPSHGQR
jgi:outer membrane protein assembly factor BamB